MKKIVLDIETKNTFQEVGAREPSALDLSVMVVYDYASDQYLSFTEDNLNELWPILESADLIIGYNLDHFDMPILNKYYAGDLLKLPTLDLLTKIKEAYGKRIGLDAVAAGTLGANKSAHGLQAVAWWKEGKIDLIKEYCQQDVKLTKEVYDYARANNQLKYKVFNDIISFPLAAGDWEKPAEQTINFTLPF